MADDLRPGFPLTQGSMSPPSLAMRLWMENVQARLGGLDSTLTLGEAAMSPPQPVVVMAEPVASPEPVSSPAMVDIIVEPV